MKIFHLTAPIIENTEIAASLWRLRLEAPQIAAAVRPGQFCMLRLPGAKDPLLGRPLAIYDTTTDSRDDNNVYNANDANNDSANNVRYIDVIYAVVGAGTRLLSQRKTDMELEVWGPLGNGWTLDGVGVPVLVAGGIGQTPMYMLAQALLRSGVEKIHLLMGSRDAAHLSCVEDFTQLSESFGGRLELRIATDDGSVGHHGFVTELLGEMSGELRVFACGPKPMLRRVAEIAHEKNASCQVSLETPMACGMGICFTCVTKCRANNDDGWDYCRTCVDGPVFDAEKLVWD